MENRASLYGCWWFHPFANVFTEQFPEAELVLIGPGDDEGNAHAPNESVSIEDIEKLIQSLINTLKNY